MEERSISPEESLQIVQKMISESRMKVVENGLDLLLWGFVIMLTSVLYYFMIKLKIAPEYGWLIWPIAMGAAFCASFIMHYYQKKKSRVRTNTLGKINNFVWLSFGISLVMVMFISSYWRIVGAPFILIVVAIAPFVSSRIIDYRPLMYGAIIFWLGAIACLFVRPVETLLINAAAMLLGYIIPGILLWKKYKKEQHV